MGVRGAPPGNTRTLWNARFSAPVQRSGVAWPRGSGIGGAHYRDTTTLSLFSFSAPRGGYYIHHKKKLYTYYISWPHDSRPHRPNRPPPVSSPLKPHRVTHSAPPWGQKSRLLHAPAYCVVIRARQSRQPPASKGHIVLTLTTSDGTYHIEGEINTEEVEGFVSVYEQNRICDAVGYDERPTTPRCMPAAAFLDWLGY